MLYVNILYNTIYNILYNIIPFGCLFSRAFLCRYRQPQIKQVGPFVVREGLHSFLVLS